MWQGFRGGTDKPCYPLFPLLAFQTSLLFFWTNTTRLLADVSNTSLNHHSFLRKLMQAWLPSPPPFSSQSHLLKSFCQRLKNKISSWMEPSQLGRPCSTLQPCVCRLGPPFFGSSVSPAWPFLMNTSSWRWKAQLWFTSAPGTPAESKGQRKERGKHLIQLPGLPSLVSACFIVEEFTWEEKAPLPSHHEHPCSEISALVCVRDLAAKVC